MPLTRATAIARPTIQPEVADSGKGAMRASDSCPVSASSTLIRMPCQSSLRLSGSKER